MTTSVRSRKGPHHVSVAAVRNRAQRMLHAIGRNEAEISILLVDEQTIRELNRRYRDLNKPTDVLSFSLRQGEFCSFAGDLLGDVVVCVPIARRQARRVGHTTLDEITLLIAHGLLHLAGFDHDNRRTERRMNREVRRLVCLAIESTHRGSRRSRVGKPPCSHAS